MKKLLSLLLLSLVFILGACGDEEEEKTNEVMQPQDIKVEEDEAVAEDKVVITINGTEVLGDRYNTTYLQTKMRAYQFGQDIDDKDNIKEITLNELIAQELIKQEAKNQGVEVSEEEVQAEFDKLKTQDEKQFNAYLETYDLTEDTLKEQLRFGQTLKQYVAKEIEIEEVTDEDIKETYEELKKDMDDIMTFEEAEPIIKAQLTQQREADALQVKVEELMEKADIEKNI
jgi:hypothetical protein